MENWLSHSGTDGEIDTVKKTGIFLASDTEIMFQLFTQIWWRAFFFFTLDYSEHDLVFDKPICILHPANEKPGVLLPHIAYLQAVITFFVLVVGASYTLGIFVQPGCAPEL